MRWFLLALMFAIPILSFAQYHCDWNTFDAGGAFLSSTDFQANVSVAQTAIGSLTGTNYHSFIGFWQIEPAPGIEEDEPQRTLNPTQLETKLYYPQPNPFTNNAKILFSVKSTTKTKLQIFDRNGRMVRTLVDGCLKFGIYTMSWHGEDDSDKKVAQGIYFLKFQADNYQKIRKLLLVR
jgi:hypothetical protein